MHILEATHSNNENNSNEVEFPTQSYAGVFCMLLNHFKEPRHDLWEHETAFDLTNTDKDQFVVVCNAVIGPEVVITLSSSLTTKWSRGRYQGCFGYY